MGYGCLFQIIVQFRTVFLNYTPARGERVGGMESDQRWMRVQRMWIGSEKIQIAWSSRANCTHFLFGHSEVKPNYKLKILKTSNV